MQKPTEGMIDAGMEMLSVLKPKEQYDESRRVNRAIDAQGRFIDHAPRERLWTSPDGSQWVERIDNTGVRLMKKVT